MKNYITKKSVLAIVLFLYLFAIEMITFASLDLNVMPMHWWIDIMSFLFIAILGLVLPLTLQLILNNLALFSHVLLSLINLILYASSGKYFSLSMILLIREATQVTDMIVVPYGVVITVAILFISYIALSIVFKIKSKEKHYMKFVKVLMFKVCSIIAVIALLFECFIPVILINSKKGKIYYSSSSYIYSTLESPYVCLSQFGIWGYYVTDFFRKAFPALSPSVSYASNYKKKNYTSELSGLCKDDNVIVILAESFELCAISQATTPVLYAMQQGIDLTENGILDFYNVIIDESTGEKILNRKDFDDLVYNNTNIFEGKVEDKVGLELSNYKSYETTAISENKILTGNNITTKFSIANMLKNNGYTTNYVHGNYGSFYQREDRIGNFGFENILFYNDMIDKIECSGDLSFFCKDKDIVSYYLNNQQEFDFINDDKFLTFMMTISTHGYYSPANDKQVQMLEEYYNKFDAYANAYSNDEIIKLYSSISGSTLKNKMRTYLSKTIDTEEAVALLVNQLFEEGKLDNTTIVFASDHDGYSDGLPLFKFMYMDYKYGSENYRNAKKYTVPAFIYSTKIKNEYLESKGYSREISSMTSQFDIPPTLLTLLGIEYNQDCYMGYAVINKDVETGECLYNKIVVSCANGCYLNDEVAGFTGTSVDFAKFNEPYEYIEDIHEQIGEYISQRHYILDYLA